MNTLLVIPAYNEEDCIVSTIEELRSVAPDRDFIIVNDGSSDKTEELCRAHGYPHLSLPINTGLTCGFQTGLKYALEHGYDAVMQFDADGQHMPHFVDELIRDMEKTGADIVIGSRFVTERKSFSARMIGSRLISGIIRLTTGARIADPTSGLRLFSKPVMEQLASKRDFGPEPDSIAYLVRHGAKVAEVQVKMRERTSGQSYLTAFKSVQYMLRACVSILFVQWFR